MKINIQDTLLKAKPAPAKKQESLDDYLALYLAPGCGNRVNLESYLEQLPKQAARMNDRWEWIVILIGTMYRAHSDGHDLFQKAGLTAEKSSQIFELLTELRGLISRGQTAAKTTTTKALYDQIVSNGF